MKYLAYQIGKLTVESKTIEFENADFKLSETKAFSWRRNLPPLVCERDYPKSSGAIGYYHPDWVVVQKTPKGEVNWIIETKGRVWEGTERKDEAIRRWCAGITERTKQQWRFARINQSTFDAKKPATLADAVSEGKAQSALL